MITWKATLINNTDYRQGAEFYSLQELREFIPRYYRGEPGNLYSESWEVEGEYPKGLYAILDPPLYDGDTWKRK